MHAEHCAPLESPDSTSTELEVVLGELRKLHATDSLAATFRMGELVVEHVYSGGVPLGRRDGLSLRKLAAQVGSGITASTLSRAAGIYMVLRRRGTRPPRQLAASHVQEVLGLPPETQDQLLERAVFEGWSVLRLRHAASMHRAPCRRARRHASSATARLRPGPVEVPVADAHVIRTLDIDTARALRDRAKSACQQNEMLARQLHSHILALQLRDPPRPPLGEPQAQPSGKPELG